MTRREILALAFAPQQLNYRSYSRALPDYLTRLAKEAYTRRQQALNGLTTPAAVKARQVWVRDTFWKLTGGQPARTPLNLRTVGEFRRDGYRVEKVVYESQPGLVITANLYLPDGIGRFPGVLFQMGHSLNGKAAEPYQKCCQGLARLGYVVLAFDPMGQGERTYYPQPNGTLTRLDSADEEHTLPGRQLLLAGLTSTQVQTWDAVRSLDVLAAHPSVDPRRLASTGTSGGGTLTMMLGAVDDRLACAAISCGNTENYACQSFIAPGSVDDAEQNFVGGGPLGFDRWDLLYPLAPKPVAFVMSGRDFQGTYSPNYLVDGRQEFARLERTYQVMGQSADRLRWVETPLPHSLSEPLRIEIYQWFERWLKGSSRRIVNEPPVSPEPDETLWCGGTGNAVRDFSSRTPRQLIPAPRTQPADWAKLTGAELRPTARLKVVGQTRFGPVGIQAVEVQSELEVHVPAWLYAPANAKHCILLLEDSGKSTRWQEGNLYHRLTLRGVAACAMDVRGLYDLRPALGSGAAAYAISHFEEEFWAWGCLMLGRPLIGQRITDILAVVTALKARGLTVELAASGRLIPAALLATVLDAAIARLTITGPVPSFRAIAAAEEYKQPMADWIPNILSYSDLPDAAQSLGLRLRTVGRLDTGSLL